MIKTTEPFCQSIDSISRPSVTMTKQIEHTVRLALLRASIEKRVIVGLSDAIRALSQTPNNSLICFLAESEREDSATNMNVTLLEAFCYENDIYVIKVDCAEKLCRILGVPGTHPCALIQKPMQTDTSSMEYLTAAEHALVDHCELHWDWPDQVLTLPV